MNFKRKLLLLLISLIIPWNIFAYSKYLIPGGENIGIKVEASGVYVVGFYKVDGESIAEKSGFKLGDRIISINHQAIDNVRDLVKIIKSNDEVITLTFGYVRDDISKETTLTLKKDNDGTYKTGIYVKDSLIGIGTITYIDPETHQYGALGHEIVEANTGVRFEIREGVIYSSKVNNITKSLPGSTGEKKASIDYDNTFGNIIYNNETGIYGNYQKEIKSELVPVASLDEVEIGKAEIITVLENNTKKEYEIEILSIIEDNETKNFMFKIIDNELLQKTGGVVKGMSGSPIMQNGKIIGAVTHAIVDSPDKGFGISIIKMLESIE